MTKTLKIDDNAIGHWIVHLDDDITDEINTILIKKGYNCLTEDQKDNLATIKRDTESDFDNLDNVNVSKIREDIEVFKNQIDKMIEKIDKLKPHYKHACYTLISFYRLNKNLLEIKKLNDKKQLDGKQDQLNYDLIETNEKEILGYVIKDLQKELDIKLTAYKDNNEYKGTAIDIMMALLPDITKHHKAKILKIIKELKSDNK